MSKLNTGEASLQFTTFHNVVNGNLTDSSSGETYHSINPSTLQVNPEVPLSTHRDVNQAVDAARAAAETWANTPWSERKKKLEDFATALESQTEPFSEMLVKENGKPLLWARIEVQSCVKWIRGICDLSLPDNVIEDTERRRIIEKYTPLGVAVGIVPWNFPLMLSFFKIPAALLTGNVFILKPSPFTPYCCLKIAELGLRFFPPGVLQAISGDDRLGPWFTEHPGVDKVAFTGSISTGKKILQTCSGSLKRVTLEMGGNDPAIICGDVDIAAIVPKVAMISFVNSGQLCMAVKRLYVHESIYDAFLAALVDFVESNLIVGDGFEENSFIGPITHQAQFDRVTELLEHIRNSDTKIATKRSLDARHQGFFIQPVVLDNPPEDSRPVVDETFGPILPLLRWGDESDVIQRANNTEYGLGASVWSKDITQANRIANKMKAGSVWINTHGELEPNVAFGCHKSSGFGVECGVEGLKAYCNVQSVYSRPG
ncbi:Aldehyde/histidinol dehydrogenase [Xylariaceae sp. FL1651]|nr:Aldehyde/histidinol dehydrogenase [Xylariaceae sp. FL1651]